MLSLKSIPYLPRHQSISKSRIRSFSPNLLSSFSTKSMDPTTATTIEHVVLFKVKDSVDPTGMLTALRSLTSLNLTTHLAAAPVLRSPSSSPFTHLLHSRYHSKSDLSSYADHPDHVSAVRSHVLPSCEQIMAVDWISSSPSSLSPPPPGSAVRVTLAKPKTGGSPSDLLAAVAEATSGAAGGAVQISYGLNFSPARAQGYEVAMVAVFPGVEEMEKAMGSDDVAKEKEKVRELVESVIIVDYVVPEVAATASL